MTCVSILPVADREGTVSFRAVSGGLQSQGRTAGEALDALTAQLPAEENGMVVVIQHFRPDRFFGAAQQQRLAMLMQRWRAARDRDETLSLAEQAELEALVDAELQASAARAAARADELGR